MKIEEDDLTRQDIRNLLEQHFAHMLASSPKDSCHFLDFEGLKAPGVTFWTARNDGELLGCGALKRHDDQLGEIKSMRTVDQHRGKGVAAAMVTHIIAVARSEGLDRLSLETGSGTAFDAANGLYQRFGFTPCPPFADYQPDPFSRFYTLSLD